MDFLETLQLICELTQLDYWLVDWNVSFKVSYMQWIGTEATYCNDVDEALERCRSYAHLNRFDMCDLVLTFQEEAQ